MAYLSNIYSEASRPQRGVFRWKSTTKESEVPRPKGGASRRGSFAHSVPLNPAYEAGLAGHGSAKKRHDFHFWEFLFSIEGY